MGILIQKYIYRLLLERGADPHARDLIGNTALHLAACTNNIDVVLLLLKAGKFFRGIKTCVWLKLNVH